jgi:predicted membrane channel-forming protein YqfA (hemolysin III family)
MYITQQFICYSASLFGHVVKVGDKLAALLSSRLDHVTSVP